MKKIETIRNGKNFTAINLGKTNELKEYVLNMGPGMEIKGKVFLSQALGTTGSEISMNSISAGKSDVFTHTHKTHEELYFILKGKGEYQVDGDIFPIFEGSVVRVAPDGVRAMRNTGDEEMLMICIQYKANSFGEDDNPMTDGNIIPGEPKW